MSGGEMFHGHGGDCGEHRTVGSHRAWCYQCAEWCYPSPDNGCRGCRKSANVETVTMVGPNGQVVEGVDRETAAAATALMADIETRITAAYEQGKEVGRVNGAARLDEMQAELHAAYRESLGLAAKLAAAGHLLTLVREQRDTLAQHTRLVAHAAPCGDGRCYCGGCVL